MTILRPSCEIGIRAESGSCKGFMPEQREPADDQKIGMNLKSRVVLLKISTSVTMIRFQTENHKHIPYASADYEWKTAPTTRKSMIVSKLLPETPPSRHASEFPLSGWLG